MDQRNGTISLPARPCPIGRRQRDPTLPAKAAAGAAISTELETYQKIIDAYSSQLSTYEAHLASIQNSQALGLNDLHPDKKRQIDRDELQKGSLVLLTNQDFSDLNAVVPNAAPYGYPELDMPEAMEEDH